MKTYGQYCGVARALDVVGERWTLLLVRDLLLGPRRYGELRAGLPGLTTNLLAQRLQHLQDAGVVARRADGAYALTDDGRRLEPVVLALEQFGAPYLHRAAPAPGARADVRWALLSLKRRYQRSRWSRTLVLEVGAEVFTLRLGGEVLELVAGRQALSPDGVLQGEDEALWRALLQEQVALDAALQAGRLRWTGERTTLEDFALAVGLRLR